MKRILIALFAIIALSASALAQLTAGKYYIIRNMQYGTYLRENLGSSRLTCGELKMRDISSYWLLVEDGTKYYLQNVLTEHWVQRLYSSEGSQYTTAFDRADGGSFTIRKYSATGFQILDQGAMGFCCNKNANVLEELADGGKSSQWEFEEIALTEDMIEAGRATITEYNDLMQNKEACQAALRSLFEDDACTVLKDAVQRLTDSELKSHPDYLRLGATLQTMVLKVKNDSWQQYTASDGYTRGMEKFFRVRDDYKVYSHHRRMADNARCGMSNCFGRLSGPTGIVGTKGDVIYLFVGEEPSRDCTLLVEVVKDDDSPGDFATGYTTPLHKGMNVIMLDEPSTLYIFYQLDDTSRYIDDYPDMTVHIEGGRLQGYFDLTRGMTNRDWKLLRETMLSQSTVINMKNDHQVFVMNNKKVQAAVGSAGEMEGLLRVWNAFLVNEENLMGFSDDLKKRYRNIWNVFSMTHDWMYATSYGTYFYDGTLSEVLNYKSLTTSSGAIWGPCHEMGHNHQACFNVVGATEVSNNLFSNVNVFLQGITTTRGAEAGKTFTSYADGLHWLKRGIWEQTRMYFQLYLYYHVQGHNPDFYPTLFRLLRQDPVNKHSGSQDLSLKDDKGNTVGGTRTLAKDDYLHLARLMCKAAGEDLSEFFQVYGMFIPIRDMYVGDYGSYWVTATEADIADAIAYMHQFPRAASICFIDDRIKPSPVITDSNLEGKPTSEYRRDYDTKKVGEVGDVGQWSDFVKAYQTDGYYYTTSTKNSQPSYDISGSGAIGFKVYDNAGELVYLSNMRSFTLPEKVRQKVSDGCRIVAVEANGYEVLVPYAPAISRGEMTAYYAGDSLAHTVYYAGAGAKEPSLISPLPANSVAYVKDFQNTSRQPSSELLAMDNVVIANRAERLVLDGDMPFYIPEDITASQLFFSKHTTGSYHALSLPFDVTADSGTTLTTLTAEGDVFTFEEAKTVEAGNPLVIHAIDTLLIQTTNQKVYAGTYTAADGYILTPDGQRIEQSIASPFTYLFPSEAENATRVVDHKVSDESPFIYTLTGCRASYLHRGLYIMNGRKVLVR